MKIELITNKGIHSLREELEIQLKSSKGFSIASAFITREGVETLGTFLTKNRSKDRIGRVLISLYNGFNTRQALQLLKELSIRSKGKIQARISKDLWFHWKYYQFNQKAATVIYVGSANLTKSGIQEQGELQAKISCTAKESKYLLAFKAEFNKEWENSFDLLKFPIKKYQQISRSSLSFSLHPDIKKLFELRKALGGRTSNEINAIILVETTLSKKAQKVVYQNQSRWDKEGWDFYCSATKREYEFEGSEGNLLLMVEKTGNKFRFKKIRVMDNCLLSTDDGKYFIAFKQLGKTKRENKALSSELQELGINYHRRRFNYKYRLSKRALAFINNIV